jgi:hypothetical protein
MYHFIRILNQLLINYSRLNLCIILKLNTFYLENRYLKEYSLLISLILTSQIMKGLRQLLLFYEKLHLYLIHTK